MPEETGRVVAVQAEVQYQPAEIAGQCVRIGANPEAPGWSWDVHAADGGWLVQDRHRPALPDRVGSRCPK